MAVKLTAAQARALGIVDQPAGGSLQGVLNAKKMFAVGQGYG